jgi:hypothetical protein
MSSLVAIATGDDGCTINDGSPAVDPTTGTSVGWDGMSSLVAIAAEEDGCTIKDGRPPVDPMIGISVGTDRSTSLVPTTAGNDGRTISDGKPAVEPTTGASVGCDGTSSVELITAEEVISLEAGTGAALEVDKTTGSVTSAVDSTVGEEGASEEVGIGGGLCSTIDEDVGSGSGCRSPVPSEIALEPTTGTGVTTISVTTVVVSTESAVLLTTSKDEEEDKSGGVNSDLKNDERSGWLDSESAVLVLEDEVDDVDEAGAVALVTICRFTCRGK